MKKDSKDSQIYRVDNPSLTGLLLAIDVATGKTNDAFNVAINNYLNTTNSLDPLLLADRPAQDAEIIYNRAHPDAAKTFKLAVYFNASNTDRFGTMHPVTYDANGEITTVDAAIAAVGNPLNGLTAADFQILEFTPEEINALKLINKGNDVANLATKIQLVTQSFHLLYDKIPGDATTDPKMIVNTKITNIINAAVDTAGDAFKTYCGVLVDLGKAYNKGSEKFDGVSVELDINYPVALNATPVIIDQRPITDQNDVNHLLNFAITCLGAKLTTLTGEYKIGGTRRRRRRRNKKSSKRRSQKRSNKRKGKKSRRRIRRRSHRK